MYLSAGVQTAVPQAIGYKHRRTGTQKGQMERICEMVSADERGDGGALCRRGDSGQQGHTGLRDGNVRTEVGADSLRRGSCHETSGRKEANGNLERIRPGTERLRHIGVSHRAGKQLPHHAGGFCTDGQKAGVHRELGPKPLRTGAETTVCRSREHRDDECKL